MIVRAHPDGGEGRAAVGFAAANGLLAPPNHASQARRRQALRRVRSFAGSPARELV
jgi:hypothetical protein